MFEVLKGHTGSCQRRTCLKWEINGELSASDRKNLMQLLCQVDKQACIDDVGLELDAETEMEGMWLTLLSLCLIALSSRRHGAHGSTRTPKPITVESNGKG